MTIKVVLADDEELFRAGIALILSRDPEIEIIYQASIDIYAMSCVLSRCTVSLNQAAASARHEELITKVRLGQEPTSRRIC